VAIALDGGVPDYSADGLAGHRRLGIFRRERDNAEPSGPAPRASAAPAPASRAQASPVPASAASALPAAALPSVSPPPLAPGRPGPRPRGGAHRAPSRRSNAGRRPLRASARPAPDAPAPADRRDAGGRAAPAGQQAPARPLPSLSGLVAARIGRTASLAEPAPAATRSPGAADFDALMVKETFACLTANAPLAMEHFYSHLFISNPETRAMFPMEMSQMRERLFTSLSQLVQSLDSAAESAAYLAELGRGHRKYGVKEKHFEAFFNALLETAAHFAGRRWTPQAEAAWRGAMEYAARTMRSAAEADARDYPAWWVGEIVEHDRRGESVAVVTIRPDKPLPYRAGQYLPVQVPRWPRVWRPYSIANAPRADGLINLHVRAVPGGMVSADLVRHASIGDTVLLGPAAGEMTAPPPGSDGDLTCIAGGTGLAPIKAIVEAAVGSRRAGRPRRITLFVGARRMDDLYDLPDLQAMQSAYPGLQVILVLSDEPALSSQPLLPEQQAAAGLIATSGLLPGVVLAHGPLDQAQTYICGPAAMVAQTARMIAGHAPAGQVHYDPLPAGPLPAGPVFAARPAELASPGEPDAFRRSPLFAKFARPGFAPEQQASADLR
jgi:NAD(P)H-flavin reductase/hemoglobin-like flavoprotein